MAISDYSTTPASNTSISGIDIAENCAPAGINNAIRQMMADIKSGAGTFFQAYDADLTTWGAVIRAAGFDTFTATPSSANLRTLVTDESGTGALLFANGALGTPVSGVLTNATGLPPATGLAWTARGRIIRGGAAAWEELALGTAGQSLFSDGTDIANRDPIVSGTVNTTTGGTAIEFSVPTWVKKITLSFDGPSLSGTDHFLVQLSTSAAYVTTGYGNGGGGAAYSSVSGNGTTSTAGLPIYGNLAAAILCGTVDLIKHTGNTWVSTHAVYRGAAGTDDVIVGAGRIALAGAIDGIRLTRSGANTFDAMSLNVHYQ